jgi:nucleotide-binding universal stress UspA family protein
MNPKKILVPVTLSAGSIAAVTMAASLAREAGASLVLLHVAAAGCAMLGPNGVEGASSRAPALAAQLAQLGKKAAPGISLECLVRLGDPPQVIVRTTEEMGADAIVMSTHGYRGWLSWVHRHTARKVVRCSPCPVWLVSPSAKYGGPVVQVRAPERHPRNLAAPRQPAWLAACAHVAKMILHPDATDG